MKWFTKRTDLTSLWVEDGDLMRIKTFFQKSYPEGDEQIKQSIKQKALEKMAEKEPDTFTIPVRAGLVNRISSGLRTIFGLRSWKLGVSALGIALLVIIGNEFMNGSVDLLPRIGSKEKASQFMNTAPQATGGLMNEVDVSKGEGFKDEGINNSLAAKDFAVPQTPASLRGSAKSSDTKTIEKGEGAYANPVLPVPIDPVIVPPADSSIPRKITHNLNLTLEVKTINESVTKICSEAQQLGGYVVESQQNGTENNSSAHLTLKIPANKLNGLRDSLSTWGKILDQHLIANDITNQYYDSQVRLQTLESEEKRYLDILNQAKSVEDVLKVENALANIRQQIEQLKGQIKLWNNMIDYSTVNLQLVTKQNQNLNVNNPWQPIAWGSTWQATKNAVLKTISTSWNLLNYLVVGLGYALPYLLIIALAWFLYK